jgi:UDP-N-acetylmuramoyl-tripeptide--D-alanyl-D-alanine ligase
VIVIDDSYNANPVGAAAALEVLRAHPAKRRILVTPGMVELGSEERTANWELGMLAAKACDYCILSGSRAPIIRDGLLAAGFPEAQIVVTSDGPAAHAKVAEITQRGDVILFENDLPDVYA